MIYGKLGSVFKRFDTLKKIYIYIRHKHKQYLYFNSMIKINSLFRFDI